MAKTSERVAAEIGCAVQDARESAGMKRIELAAKAGVSLSVVVAIETGSAGHLDTYNRLAKALRLSFGDLIARAGV